MPEGHIVALVGPTRVGKTTLTREALTSLYPSPHAGDEKPAISLQVETTDRGHISTRYLFLKILKALDHPFHSEPQPGDTHATETAIRLRIPYAIEARNTKVLILDEAHHLLRMRNRYSTGAALDSLKCLGNETGLRILLAGSYELLTTCFNSAHLNGRLTVLDFPRYKSEGKDTDEFSKLLTTYDQLLPWRRGMTLFRMRDFMYAGSLGCCGLISSWIQSALGRMEAEGDRWLTAKHFHATRFMQQLEEIRIEIERGESLLTPIPLPTVTTEPAPRKRRYPPGKRNPIRDKVGGATL
jgi:hypothetical protein